MPASLLPRPEGRIAYTVEGDGPLVVCVPGVGDTRAEYRHLAPRLVAAGHRVAVMDLRGHGESDTTFTTLDRAAIGDDVVALVRHLDDQGTGPVHLVGCSLGASAAVWAAAELGDRVASVTLIGAFVRDHPDGGIGARLRYATFRLALARPWGPRAWVAWHRRLFPGTVPDDLGEQAEALRANLAEPGRLEAMRRLGLSSCAAIEPRLDEVTARSLVVMGTADPDWPDATAEGRWIAQRLGGELELVDGAGHYPHVEVPGPTADRIVGFLAHADGRV